MTFVCRNRSGTKQFFAVSFEIAALEAGEESGTGANPTPTVTTSTTSKEAAEEGETKKAGKERVEEEQEELDID